MNTRHLWSRGGRSLGAVLLAFALATFAGAETTASTEDLNQGPVTKELDGGLVVQFEIFPRPIPAMKQLEFALTLTRDGKAVEGAEVSLEFTMPAMYMGKNSPTLVEVSPGRFEGKGLIVRCMSGDKRWLATIVIKEAGGSHKVAFPLEVS